jgi:hypothetical protein
MVYLYFIPDVFEMATKKKNGRKQSSQWAENRRKETEKSSRLLVAANHLLSFQFASVRIGTDQSL